MREGHGSHTTAARDAGCSASQPSSFSLSEPIERGEVCGRKYTVAGSEQRRDHASSSSSRTKLDVGRNPELQPAGSSVVPNNLHAVNW